EEAQCVVQRGENYLLLSEEMCERLGAALEAEAERQAPATGQAPELPPPDTGTDWHIEGMGEGAYTAEAMRERDCMGMARIAALGSEQAPAGEVLSILQEFEDWVNATGVFVKHGSHYFECREFIERSLATPPAVIPSAVPPGNVLMPGRLTA